MSDSIKNKVVALGGSQWSKNGMERVYIGNDVMNILRDEKGMAPANFGERNNKIFLDVKTGAIMRSYKGKKPAVEFQV
jgi:hypothetical protein